MDTIKFVKMHGLGNDYVYIDGTTQEIKNPSKLSKKMSDRHFGIGSDGIILILPSDKADFKMRMFNADGSEAEMCGNGIRCFAKFVYDHKKTKKETIAIETLAGIKTVELNLHNNKVSTVTVNMGEPILLRDQIPMEGEPGMVIEEAIEFADHIKFEVTALSMGNPHAVIFVEDVENFPVSKYGPIIENHPLFTNRTNVEFVQVLNDKEVIQRTWERGAGETYACGTGACAVTVASVLTKRTGRKLKIHLKGGDLKLNWDEKSNNIYKTGAAVEVFKGEWPLSN